MIKNDTMNEKKIENHYDGREILCFANRPNDFLEIFEGIVEKCPERSVLCFEGKTVTYKQLDEFSDSFAAGLLRSGLKEKNILVINIANSIEFVVALFAAFKIGLIAMPVGCLLYTSPSPRDQRGSRMPSSA